MDSENRKARAIIVCSLANRMQGLNDKSRMSREVPVRFCESVRVRFPRATRRNIYVKSEKAGKRIMGSVVKYLTNKLKLKVNEQKSAVAHPWERKFLGFTFTTGRQAGRIIVHPSRVKRLKDKIRMLNRKLRGSNVMEGIQKWIMPITRGWANYFGIAEVKRTFEGLDGWIRRKIRGIQWRQWKKPKTRYKRLVALGVKETQAKRCAWTSKGPWRMAKTYEMHQAMSNLEIESMGYIPMTKLVCGRSE